MSNLYEVIGVSRNSTTGQINIASQNKLKEIKKMNVSSEEKNKLSKMVTDAYNILSDYHKRRSHDEYLESQIAPMNFFGTNMLNRNLFNDMKTQFKNFDKFPNSNGNFQQSYSSTIQNVSSGDGSTIYKKTYSNVNGKVNETSQKITVDKEGNKKVEDLNKNSNKYNIDNTKKNHKIKYNI